MEEFFLKKVRSQFLSKRYNWTKYSRTEVLKETQEKNDLKLNM